ncbi:MAG: CPBP family intramembrane metalloprotease, partial [Clostridiales Family XIII bacterium]|nr:CPBP family intramembrane metalloprotease [Clostridiales Family XIII bacterium]
IVMGAVSLADDYPHVMDAIFTGNSMMSGGIYKLEGSVVVFIVNILPIAFVAFLLSKKQSAKNVGNP